MSRNSNGAWSSVIFDVRYHCVPHIFSQFFGQYLTQLSVKSVYQYFLAFIWSEFATKIQFAKISKSVIFSKIIYLLNKRGTNKFAPSHTCFYLQLFYSLISKFVGYYQLQFSQNTCLLPKSCDNRKNLLSTHWSIGGGNCLVPFGWQFVCALLL